MKKDLIVALVKELTWFEPKRLKIVLPADASKARNANKIYSTINILLSLAKNKRLTIK